MPFNRRAVKESEFDPVALQRFQEFEREQAGTHSLPPSQPGSDYQPSLISQASSSNRHESNSLLPMPSTSSCPLSDCQRLPTIPSSCPEPRRTSPSCCPEPLPTLSSSHPGLNEQPSSPAPLPLPAENRIPSSSGGLSGGSFEECLLKMMKRDYEPTKQKRRRVGNGAEVLTTDDVLKRMQDHSNGKKRKKQVSIEEKNKAKSVRDKTQATCKTSNEPSTSKAPARRGRPRKIPTSRPDLPRRCRQPENNAETPPELYSEDSQENFQSSFFTIGKQGRPKSPQSEIPPVVEVVQFLPCRRDENSPCNSSMFDEEDSSGSERLPRSS
ncbi:hypothetical protein GE061_006032 [Apolygus lucorum]|uniref:Uncharacterized protein n=1 Tax=Apolygus lucorum TaxID=248454 RepID=A0A8S9WU44_APOLU|nr:hypothetical protein GE061_006032 [Apolygus lucorum]